MTAAPTLSLAQVQTIYSNHLAEWIGTANDVSARFITDDVDLKVYVRPVLTDRIRGLDLVDVDGEILASAWVVR